MHEIYLVRSKINSEERILVVGAFQVTLSVDKQPLLCNLREFSQRLVSNLPTDKGRKILQRVCGFRPMLFKHRQSSISPLRRSKVTLRLRTWWSTLDHVHLWVWCKSSNPSTFYRPEDFWTFRTRCPHSQQLCDIVNMNRSIESKIEPKMVSMVQWFCNFAPPNSHSVLFYR